jgi:hypothetical protein
MTEALDLDHDDLAHLLTLGIVRDNTLALTHEPELQHPLEQGLLFEPPF